MIINRLRKPPNCIAENRRISIEHNRTMRLLIVRPENQKKAADTFVQKFREAAKKYFAEQP